jgi:hypothetical protein
MTDYLPTILLKIKNFELKIKTKLPTLPAAAGPRQRRWQITTLKSQITNLNLPFTLYIELQQKKTASFKPLSSFS